MLSYLIKIGILAIFSFIIIYYYYFTNSAHLENFDGYFIYVVIIGIIYAIYKFIQLEFTEKIVKFSPIKILGFFLLHLFVLSLLFFSYNDSSVGFGISLFFKILFYLFIPTLIVIISLGFGKKITSYLPNIKNESSIYGFIISMGVGFFSFVFLLDIFGILGFYNLYLVFGILLGFIIFSYRELLSIFNDFLDFKFKFDIEEGNYLKLISTEFLFLVSTLVVSISLISIVRPFPIGWDDLGAYMNIPHLMAQAGTLTGFGGMTVWHSFTGIGYMFGSPTQAFFLNNVGGILSLITIILIFSDLLKSKIKTFINIPMLLGTMFISMPMIVFQQAKDMKLDPGLFFISIIVVYLVFKYYLKSDSESNLEKFKGFIDDKILHKSFNKFNLIIILIIGILAGFAFSIKFTTLLLISAVIGVMSFSRLGILGFISYLSLFFAIFTKANLWGMMNVTVNPGKIAGFETNFAIVSGMIGLALMFHVTIKNKIIVKKFFMEVGVFILGIIIALSPWIGKNIYESYPSISFGSILGGKSERFNFDETLIYTENEIKKIEEEKRRESISSEGTTTNEDLGRYFGYETGVNNYLKLPWNLTMQRNQGGEFTDIGYIYLALLPVILLFLPYRKKYYPFLIILVLIFELLIFIKTDNKIISNYTLSTISQDSKDKLFTYNRQILKKGGDNNIYNIDLFNYVSKNDVKSLVTKDSSYEFVMSKIREAFYSELKSKIVNEKLGKELVLIKGKGLTEKDFNYIKELRVIKNTSFNFTPDINSLVILQRKIINLKLDSDKDNLIKIWKDNITINQYISDYFSSFNLPFGYIIILFIFLLPLFLLLYGLDKKDKEEGCKVDLLKLSLIFASFYTFLWTISAFGIVWYGITMYFVFLLIIGIGSYYIVSYNEDDEKVYYVKLFGSLVLSFIFIVYIVNSVFPHTFNNLKAAAYIKYKIGGITTVDAPYLYHQEYLKILFHTNIDQTKKEDFLNEYLENEIKVAVTGIVKMDIYKVRGILNEIIKTNPRLLISAKKSLNNIYQNISNPNDEYKNKVGIYRIGTFLKYHISENNKRLLEDSLVFTFNDYIYNSNINNTIENLKKIGIGYLLVDLNAATIDKDERHNLTKRYERLLNTFTSDKLELIETDSICLKIALESFNKSKKLSEDRIEYMTIAGVNYESYTDSGKQIGRGSKMIKCFKKIESLINNKKINNNNYNYLLGINNYYIQNKDLLQNEKQLYTFFQNNITHGYKVLFKVK